MALTGTDRGSGTHNTAATSFTVTPASNLTAGAMAVLCVAADNAAASGVAFGTWTVTDTKSNTWTKRQDALNDPGAASAGVEGAIFTTPQNGGALTTSDTITVSFGSDSPVAKAWTLMEVTAAAGSSPAYVTGGTGTTGTGTTAPTITTGSIPANEMVIGALFVESGTTQTFTGDADTSSGSWSAQQTNKIGSTTSGVGITSQRKVVSATATQTYNPTLGLSGDLALAWIEVKEVTNASGTAAVSFLAPAANSTAVEAFIASGGTSFQAPAVASSGSEAIIGTAGPTLQAPAVASAGTETISGTGGVAVQAPSASTTSLETFVGTAAETVRAPSVTASGTHSESTGAAVAIRAPSVTASGIQTIAGTAAVMFGAPVLASTGSEVMTGTAAVSFLAAGIAALGGEVITGTAAASIDAPAVSAGQSQSITGNAVLTLSAPAVLALVFASSPGASRRGAVGASALIVANVGSVVLASTVGADITDTPDVGGDTNPRDSVGVPAT